MYFPPPPGGGEHAENFICEEEQVMSENKSGYIGRIKNGGTQVVKAPSQHTGKGKSTVKTGGDLRGGRSK